MAEPAGYLAMNSVLRAYQVMTSIIDAELNTGFRLRIVDYLILQALQHSATGTEKLSRIARTLHMHATTITSATDRLEDRTLVRRRPDSHDRRTTLVTITDDGRALAAVADAALNDVGFGLPGLTATQQRTLSRLLGRVGDSGLPRSRD